jgi:hypothetical protein
VRDAHADLAVTRGPRSQGVGYPDRTRGWWEEYRGVLPAAYLDLSELDHYATFRHDVSIIHVPGLFQTDAYARALFSYMNPEFPRQS